MLFRAEYPAEQAASPPVLTDSLDLASREVERAREHGQQAGKVVRLHVPGGTGARSGKQRVRQRQ